MWKRRNFWAGMLLVLAVVGVYGQTGTFDFISFDDGIYVFENPEVISGLTARSTLWSFSFAAKENTYWHPLSWLSHMLDVELYGLNPAGHHLTNVFFHLVNTVLLFFVFRSMTGACWPSFFIAALFAVHSINVESVAWVSERKNVLSTFFWMLTLLGYIYYTRKPGILRYLPVVLFLALGLLAKPMLVTLPFVLILMDFWPLGRIRMRTHPGDYAVLRKFWRLISEKAPLFLLSGLSVYLSSKSLDGIGNVVSLELVPLKLRIAHALSVYLDYLAKLVWPQDLAIFYAYPNAISLGKAGGALFILTCITGLVIVGFKNRPYMAVGWFWYFGTLIPVSGLMQAGLWPAMADRWAYVPFIGLYIMVVWGVYDQLERRKIKTLWPILGAVAALSAFVVVAWGQARYWRNSVTLFEHALEVGGNHWLFHSSLGNEFRLQGKIDEAIHQYRLALEVPPHNPEGGYLNLAAALAAKGQHGEAIHYYAEALRINPHFTAARISLGDVFTKTGRTEDARQQYLEALRLDAKSYKAHYSLGNFLLTQGNTDKALGHFSQSLMMNPGFSQARNAMGIALLRKGEVADAVGQFKLAVRLDPQNAQTRRNLNLALAIDDTINAAAARMLAAIEFDFEDPDLDRRLEEMIASKTSLEKEIGRYRARMSRQPGFTGIDADNINPVYEVKKEYIKKCRCSKKLQ